MRKDHMMQIQQMARDLDTIPDIDLYCETPIYIPALGHSAMRKCPHCGFAQSGEGTFCIACGLPFHLVAGRYSLRKQLARGGHGLIYLAYDNQEQREVVLKRLRTTHQMPHAEARFRKEIEWTQQLSRRCDHVVEIYDYGHEEGIGMYYVMEYMQGQTLEQRIHGGAPLPFSELFYLFRQLCMAMYYVHKWGLVHRDIKPSNVFLVDTPEGPKVKIFDFGLAKSMRAQELGDFTTQGILGTPHYMPPEQCSNVGISNRTDIYNMGLVLYEMLTASGAYRSKNVTELLMLQLKQMPEPLSQRRPDLHYPEGLEEALFKALSKDCHDRYPCTHSFWEAIQPFSGHQGVVTSD